MLWKELWWFFLQPSRFLKIWRFRICQLQSLPRWSLSCILSFAKSMSASLEVRQLKQELEEAKAQQNTWRDIVCFCFSAFQSSNSKVLKKPVSPVGGLEAQVRPLFVVTSMCYFTFNGVAPGVKFNAWTSKQWWWAEGKSGSLSRVASTL